MKGTRPGKEPSAVCDCVTGWNFDDSALVDEFVRSPKGGVMFCDGSS